MVVDFYRVRPGFDLMVAAQYRIKDPPFEEHKSVFRMLARILERLPCVIMQADHDLWDYTRDDQ